MLGVAFGHAPAGLAVAGDRPALVARTCATCRKMRAPPSTSGSISKSSSQTARSRRCFGQAGAEQVGRLEEVPVGGDDEVLVRHSLRRLNRPVGTMQPIGTHATPIDGMLSAVTKRWTQRPPGSTWGDWGDDDELGRINLLTPEKVLAGRARGRGRHQLLPQPAARLSRRHRAEPAAVPAACSRRPRTSTATPRPSTTST